MTSGGRVFCATALGDDLKTAQTNAYNLVNSVPSMVLFTERI